MGASIGRSLRPLTNPALIDRLRHEPYRFESAQALRILSAWVNSGPPGVAGPVRLRSSFSLTFPTSDVEAVSAPLSGSPTMTVSFFGVGGAVGPLPVRYTEFINES